MPHAPQPRLPSLLPPRRSRPVLCQLYVPLLYSSPRSCPQTDVPPTPVPSVWCLGSPEPPWAVLVGAAPLCMHQPVLPPRAPLHLSPSHGFLVRPPLPPRPLSCLSPRAVSPLPCEPVSAPVPGASAPCHAGAAGPRGHRAFWGLRPSCKPGSCFMDTWAKPCGGTRDWGDRGQTCLAPLLRRHCGFPVEPWRVNPCGPSHQAWDSGSLWAQLVTRTRSCAESYRVGPSPQHYVNEWPYYLYQQRLPLQPTPPPLSHPLNAPESTYRSWCVHLSPVQTPSA